MIALFASILFLIVLIPFVFWQEIKDRYWMIKSKEMHFSPMRLEERWDLRKYFGRDEKGTEWMVEGRSGDKNAPPLSKGDWFVVKGKMAGRVGGRINRIIASSIRKTRRRNDT